MLKKRIKNLLIYLKRKDNNILILDNELRMFEKENEEMKIDNKSLKEENKKNSKIIENLLAKRECICETGIEKSSKIIEDQKRENEKLRSRFDGLFKELDDYRKKNVELSKELEKLKDDSNYIYKEDEIYNINLNVNELKEKLNKLKRENDNLRDILKRNNIKMK